MNKRYPGMAAPLHQDPRSGRKNGAGRGHELEFLRGTKPPHQEGKRERGKGWELLGGFDPRWK